MKLKNLFLGSFALTAMLFAQSCDDKNDGPTGAPSIELSTQTLDFEKDGGSQTIKLTATRDWNVTDVPDWIAVDPKSGNPAENKEVTVTVLENTGMDRSQVIKFTIGFDAKSLTVNQKGTGSASEMIVYHNDFDKEKATQTDKKWPFLDSFEGWKNAKGSGVGSETYAYNAVTVRANSTSGSSYSDYSGSDANNLFFGSNAYFSVQGIKLSSEVNYTLSFGAEKYNKDNGSLFKHDEFHVYISNDAKKWVELEYAFPNGDKEGRWDLAKSNFTVPEGTSSLSIYIKADLASSYRLDDLDLSVAASAGTAIDFSKGIDLGTGGSTGGGETPAPTGNNIAAVCAAAAGSTADLKDVLVVGVTAKSYVISDETGKMLVYADADPKVKVGNKVNVAGTTKLHNGFMQITAPTTTVVSSNNTVTYPTPLEFTETNVTDAPKAVTYVSFTGTVKKNGTFYNIYIGSVTAKDLSLVAYPGGMDQFVDCDIKVKGWYVGGNPHYQIVATEVEKVETTGPKFSVSTTALTAKAGDTSASFDVKGNVKWTVSSSNAAYTVSPASGDGAGTVTVKFAANETEKDVTVNLTVSTTEEVATKSYTVVLTHKGKSAAGEGETKTITIATDKDWTADNHKDYGAGFSFTKDGVKYGYYKSTSNNDAVEPKADHIRVYKNSVLVIVPPAGKAITSVVIDTNHYSDKCTDMTVLTDNDSTTNTAKADTKKWTISWEGNVSTFAAKAVNSQVQIKSITVTLK